MKNHLWMPSLVLAILAMVVYASATKTQKTGYQTATVLSVEKHHGPSNYIGTGTDAPLQPDEYAYDIRIHLPCNDYVGRYESPTDYLPSVFAANHAIEVRLEKHVMFVSLPWNDQEVKMGIIGHKHEKADACESAS